MSFNCTLHPLDPRLAASLEKNILGLEGDWSYFWQNHRQKKLINQVNQRLKPHLPDLLADVPGYRPDIHLWGRPFLIYADEPETVVCKIEALYQATEVAGVLRIYLEELAHFSAAASQKAAQFQFPAGKKINVGLKSVIAELRNLMKMKQYEVAGLEVPFVLAQIAGFSLPYWHMGEFGISFLEQLKPPGWDYEPNGLEVLFTHLPQLSEHLPRRLNHSVAAGIYLDPDEVVELLAIIDTNSGAIIREMAFKQLPGEIALVILKKITEALTYAKFHHYGLLEATDVFEPGSAVYP